MWSREKIMEQRIIFVGAGGAGVSSLVHLFFTLGLQGIVAIDSTESELTNKLISRGVEVIIGHGKYEIRQDDIIIYSDAAQESPEVKVAHAKALTKRKRVFPPMSYFQFLGEVSKYMCTISIAGTHGKSTTTALTATTLEAHHPDFGLGIVGAPVKQRGYTNFLIGKERQEDIKHIIQHILFPKSPDISSLIKKHIFVVEADEYNHHFLHLDTDYACITNIELDHADVYGTFENYLASFLSFSERVRHNVYCLEEAVGIDEYIDNSKHKDKQLHTASVHHFNFQHLLGSHNHSNASLALACVADLCKKQDTGNIKNTLERFQGLRRRGELLTTNSHNVPLISDYGHHPSELASTLLALREKYLHQHITCIFQPHQARRVMEFRDAFTTTLQEFDTTIIYDIYAAREDLETLKQQTGERFSDITSIDELGVLFAKSSAGQYTTNFSDIQKILDTTSEGVIVLFTAGDLDWQVRQYLGS